MDYIETHLTEEISGKNISKIVGLSDYHYKRMFSYMARMSLNEYIKNRRSSDANVELINGEKVTDISYKYGYHAHNLKVYSFQHTAVVESFEIESFCETPADFSHVHAHLFIYMAILGLDSYKNTVLHAVSSGT
ncbi:hypothetical protein ASL11_16645 [Paenibacillus sp. Soil750]|nr:hypothetical protein ASL11_16645 [Paenibacillus sp. Soil750]